MSHAARETDTVETGRWIAAGDVLSDKFGYAGDSQASAIEGYGNAGIDATEAANHLGSRRQI